MNMYIWKYENHILDLKFSKDNFKDFIENKYKDSKFDDIWEKYKKELQTIKDEIKIINKKVSDNLYFLFSNNADKNEIKKYIEKNIEIILYHGSIEGIKGDIKVDYSKNLTDFGQGFYLGELREQAKNRVSNKPEPYLYDFALNINKFNTYIFDDDTLWALFIAYNRKKINFKNYPKLIKKIKEIEAHDIIIGNIADDKISYVYNNFLEDNITNKCLEECLKMIKYGKQYTIKNQKIIDDGNLKLLNVTKLSKEERKISCQWGQKLKENMEQQIEEYKRKYRREGKILSEILEDWK